MNKRIIKSNDEAAGGASFNTVTWAGNGTTNRSIDVGFAPDWVWVKERNPEGLSHNMYDTVRGAGLRLGSNSSGAENTLTEGVKSFDLNGFTVGNSIAVNRSGSNFVAWCWKAGDSTEENTYGTITSQVSANPGAGFSIVSYTGNEVDGATFGHGLGVKPNMAIVKSRNTVNNWHVYFDGITSDLQDLRLNTTEPLTTVTAKRFIHADINSSVIALGDSFGTNEGLPFIAYCFAEVAGFSKFGSYTGNGTVPSDSQTITLGFEPAFLLVKCSSDAGEHWHIIDNKRGASYSNTEYLFANLSNAASTNNESTGQIFNFISTGFQVKGQAGGINGNGRTYIYMAFANQF